MQILMVQPRYSFGLGSWYPALQGVTLSDEEVQQKIAYLRDSCDWNIARFEVVDDGRTPEQEEADYRAMRAAERRRGA